MRRSLAAIGLLTWLGWFMPLAGGILPDASMAGSLPADPLLEQETQSVQAVCARCHGMEIVTDTPMGYEAWHDTVQTMLDRGADATDEQLRDIMDWLHRTMTTIDVNSADAGELQVVLDVPARTAQAIVARRNKRRFTSLADLKSVRGIDSSVIDSKARLIFFH